MNDDIGDRFKAYESCWDFSLPRCDKCAAGLYDECRYTTKHATPEPAGERANMPAVLFNDPRVQIVYELLCDGQCPDNSAEHWEGWIARRIVGALSAAPEPAVKMASVPVDQLRIIWDQLAVGRRFLPSHGSFGEQGISAYETAQKIVRAMLSAQPTAEPAAQPSDAQAEDGMCRCMAQYKCRGAGEKYIDGLRCRIAAGQPLVEEFAGPVATRSGWFDRGRLQGLKEAAESVRDAWAKHAGKSFDQKFPSTTHECPKCKGFVESIEAIAALSSKPDKR